jgi:hypothetical protein
MLRGNMLLEQFGGANGELAARCNTPFKVETAWMTWLGAIFCST